MDARDGLAGVAVGTRHVEATEELGDGHTGEFRAGEEATSSTTCAALRRSFCETARKAGPGAADGRPLVDADFRVAGVSDKTWRRLTGNIDGLSAVTPHPAFLSGVTGAGEAG